MPSHPLTNFEIQKYYEININLIVFIQEIIYQKKRMGTAGKTIFSLSGCPEKMVFPKKLR